VEILDSLGEDGLAYKVVLSDNISNLAAIDLRTGRETPSPELGSMMAYQDGRMRCVDVEVNLGQKKNWSFSFGRRDMECLGCTNHQNVISFPKRGSGVRGSLQAIWLGDQVIPACLPSQSRLTCVKIVRLEHGSLMDLAEGLVRVLSGRQVAAGSVVLLTSLTNMATASTEGYAADLMAAVKYLRVNLGDHLIYGPLPCMMLNGCTDSSVIRTCFEVSSWAVEAFKKSYAMLRRGFRLTDQQLRDRGEGGL
jgi:hypothetical protein